MTTPWQIKPIWKGETVAVLASGPSMDSAVAGALMRFRTIAVNHTHRIAPFADMLVCLDANLPLWGEAQNFAGIKVCGVAHDTIDALYAGPMHETVSLSPTHRVQIMNSGLAAIRIAAAMGAARIILAGFDPHQAPQGKYVGLAQGLDAIIKELRSRGIEVERYAPTEAPPAPLTVKKTTSRRKGRKVNV